MSRVRPVSRAIAALTLLGGVALTSPPQEPTEPARRFFSRSRNYSLNLPANWRQASPDEARELRSLLPSDMHRTEPFLFYSVGPVDEWLSGRFDGVSMQVVEQRDEWPVDESSLQRLRTEWQTVGAREGVRHEVLDAELTTVGKDRREAIVCQRRSTPENGRPMRSLDVYAPTGGRMILLSLRSFEEDFRAWRPQFREMFGTLSFARRSRGSATLQDKLLWPILTGVFIGIILAVLHRRRRAG